MKHLVSLFILSLFFQVGYTANVSNHRILQNVRNTSDEYFTKSDFDKIVQPFVHSGCNTNFLIQQTKDLNAKYEYQFLYQDPSEPNISLNTLSKEEMCILLRSTHAEGLYNDELKLKKPITLWNDSDFAKHHINKIEINMSLDKRKKCIGEGGVPFITRYMKKNNQISRTIILNENSNLKCFIK